MNDCAKKMALPDPEKISSDNHLKQVCKPGQGEGACRYLVMMPGEFSCAKGSNLQSAIDQRAPTMGAQGDNCSGTPDYNVPPQGT